jgi:hypothetical protein
MAQRRPGPDATTFEVARRLTPSSHSSCQRSIGLSELQYQQLSDDDDLPCAEILVGYSYRPELNARKATLVVKPNLAISLSRKHIGSFDSPSWHTRKENSTSTNVIQSKLWIHARLSRTVPSNQAQYSHFQPSHVPTPWVALLLAPFRSLSVSRPETFGLSLWYDTIMSSNITRKYWELFTRSPTILSGDLACPQSRKMYNKNNENSSIVPK